MSYKKIIKGWLILGCILLLFQIIIGGITRITGSGLSITEWEVVTGTLPPLSEASWNVEFEKYKESPQYLKINRDMELGSIFTRDTFKFIYFWEYLHRLWARNMGFIFLFPFMFFVFKKWIDKFMVKQLMLVFFGAGLAAIFGWLMVASGLKDRPWVNAYNLTLHLGIALMTMGFLLWAVFHACYNHVRVDNVVLRKHVKRFFYLLCLQIFFGAIVSGMRASLYYPSWPDIGGSYIPDILFEPEYWTINNILDYDKSPFMPALIHVLHRNIGYLAYIYGLFVAIKILRYPLRRLFYINNIGLILFLNLQVIWGVLTLIYSKSSVPLFYGVMHQATAIFIFSVSLFNIYLFRRRRTKSSIHLDNENN